MGKIITGLTIRHDSVSAVIITGSVNGYKVSAGITVPFEALEKGGEGEEEEACSLEKALAVLKQDVNLQEGSCIVSIPAAMASFRQLQVPIKGTGKIEKILPFELEPSLPGVVEDRVIRFQSIHLPGAGEGSDLFTASVSAQELEGVSKVLSRSGIDPDMIALGICSLAQAAVYTGMMEGCGIVVDLSDSSTDMALVLNRQVVCARSVCSGCDPGPELMRLVAAFEETHDLDFQPEVIMMAGLRGGEEISSVSAMGCFEGVPVKRMDLVAACQMITGGGEGVLSFSGDMDQPFALVLMGAAGIDGINFSDRVLLVRKVWEENKASLVVSGVLLWVLLCLSVFGFVAEQRRLTQAIARVDQRIEGVYRSAFPQAKKIIDPLPEMKVKVTKAREAAGLGGAPASRFYTVDLLNNISRAIPQRIDVGLTRLRAGGETLVISGNTDTFNSVEEMKTGLSSVPDFEEVVISSANTDKSQKRVNFKLKIKLVSTP